MASSALQLEKGMATLTEHKCHNLQAMNRLDEILVPATNNSVVKVAAIPRSSIRRRKALTIMQKGIIQQMRLERIKQAQDEESWIASLKLYLVRVVIEMDTAEAKASAVIAPDYMVDEGGLLYFCSQTAANPSDRAELIRLVVPELLQNDVYTTIMQDWKVVTKG